MLNPGLINIFSLFPLLPTVCREYAASQEGHTEAVSTRRERQRERVSNQVHCIQSDTFSLCLFFCISIPPS